MDAINLAESGCSLKQHCAQGKHFDRHFEG